MAKSLENTSKKRKFIFCSKFNYQKYASKKNSVVASLQPIACVCSCTYFPTKFGNILLEHLQPLLANIHSDLSDSVTERVKEFVM